MNESSRLRQSHGHVLWSGILCIKGVYACPAELTSNIRINLPGELGRCLNLKWQVKNCTIMENYLKMVPAAGMMQKGEIFSRSWYFNICSLRPLDSKDRFSRIQDYFWKTESVSLVKSGEDILLIMSDRNLPENPGSSARRQNLHCIVLSKTSKLVRGKETAVRSDSRIDPANDFLEKPPSSSLIESSNLEESFSSFYEQQKNEIDKCDKHSLGKETKQEQPISCKGDSNEEKRKASNRIEPKERKRHKTDNSLSVTLNGGRDSSKTVVNFDADESKRKRHKSEKIGRKDGEIPHIHETKSLNVESHVFKPSSCKEKTEGALFCKITDTEKKKSVECVSNSETTPIEKKSKMDTGKKRISETAPDNSSLKKAKLLKVNETDDSPREQQDKKNPTKKKVSKISVMEKKQMECEKVLSTLNLSHCKENVRSLGRIPKKKSTTERNTDSSKLKQSPGKATSTTSTDKKGPRRDSHASDVIKYSKEKNEHEKENSKEEMKKSSKDKERDNSKISADGTVSSTIVDVKTHTSRKECRQDYNPNTNHMPLDSLQNVSNKEENAQKQTLQDPSNNTDKKNTSHEHVTSAKDGERISQESELTYERDGREDLFLLDDSPRTKSLPTLINIQDQLCRMKFWTDEEDTLPVSSKRESEIPGFGDLDLLIDLERKKRRKTSMRKIEKTEDGLLVMRNVKDTELGIWNRSLEFSDFISQALHSSPTKDGNHRVDQCPFHKAVASIHQKTFATSSSRAINLDPSDPCIITVTIDVADGHKINSYSNLTREQNISCKTQNDAQVQDSSKSLEMEGAGTKVSSDIPLTINSPRNKTGFSKNMNMDKSFVVNELDKENTLTNSTQGGKDRPEKHSTDAISLKSGKVVDYIKQEQSVEGDKAVKIDNFTEVTSKEDLCWNIAMKPMSRDIKQDCLPKINRTENKPETSKLMLQGQVGDTEQEENQTKFSQVENNANSKTLAKSRNDKKLTADHSKTVNLMGTQPENKAKTMVQQEVCDKKLKGDLSKTRPIENKPKSTKAVLEQKVCDKKLKDCPAVKKKIENQSDVRGEFQEKARHKKIGDIIAKIRQTEKEIEAAQMKSKVVVPGKEKKGMKDVYKQSRSEEEKVKKADGKSEKQSNKAKVSFSSAAGDKKTLNKEGSIQQRLEKISEQAVPEEMKTKKNEKRQARQYHPYKKEPKPKRSNKPAWSFEMAYSDMEELLLNLTENMFKIDGRNSADIRRWRKGTNKSGLCSGRGRFRGFRFNRSEIPNSLPKVTETMLSDDDKKDYKIGPELISNLEAREKQALIDIVEESWQNELEEESGFIDEMCIYTQDKDQNVAVGSSYVKTDKMKTTLIIPGMGEDHGNAFQSSKKLTQKNDLHSDNTELSTPSENRDISSDKGILGDLRSKIKAENIAVKIECESNEKSNTEDEKKVAILKALNDTTDKGSNTNEIDNWSREKKMAEATHVSFSEGVKDTAKTSQHTTETNDSETSHKQEEDYDSENKTDLNKSPYLREQKILSSDSEVCLDWTDDEILSERGGEETESDEGEEETFVVIDKLEDYHVDSSNDKEIDLTETKQSLALKDENLDKSEKAGDTLYQDKDDQDKVNDRNTSGSSQTEEHESAYVYDPDSYTENNICK